MEIWIFLSLGVLSIILLLVVFILKMRKNGWKHETDYKAIFILGIIFIPLGLVFDMSFFFILGLVYMVLGLANKDKWNKTRKPSPEMRKWLLVSVFAGLIALIVATVVFLLIA